MPMALEVRPVDGDKRRDSSLNDLFMSPVKEQFEHFSATQAEYFKDVNVATAAANMQKELDQLASTIEEPAQKKAFHTEMANFFTLFSRYLVEKSKGARLDWDQIQELQPNDIIPYAKLAACPKAQEKEHLNKLAVLKLNGGLGTTMGCVGPKSAIEVREGLTFLDLTVKQIEYRNTGYGVSIPLVLMNSFNTDTETDRLISKYANGNVNIKTFNQSRYPRISKESLRPVPKQGEGPINEWYPPGHGDVFASLYNTGLLDELLAAGKEYLFVSNIDNLGATVDTTILAHMIDSQSEFLMEVTDKTRADVKGGTLTNYDGKMRLLEIAQVPPAHVDDFKSIKKFKIFNTNNLWINLKAIKRVVEEKSMALEIIVNQKTMESGLKVIQLETAVGAAIKHFKKAHGINVPRSRFLPVKNCSDLFVVQSDLYSLHDGELSMNPKRIFPTAPLVKLGDHFRKVNNYLSRFASAPHVIDLEHLTVSGDVSFGSDVTLRGTVIIVANPPSRIDIPSGAILEDKVISGDLRILDH